MRACVCAPSCKTLQGRLQEATLKVSDLQVCVCVLVGVCVRARVCTCVCMCLCMVCASVCDATHATRLVKACVMPPMPPDVSKLQPVDV